MRRCLKRQTSWEIRLDNDNFLFASGCFRCYAQGPWSSSWKMLLRHKTGMCVSILGLSRSQLKKIKADNF